VAAGKVEDCLVVAITLSLLSVVVGPRSRISETGAGGHVLRAGLGEAPAYGLGDADERQYGWPLVRG
jgi:hypothetical protein